MKTMKKNSFKIILTFLASIIYPQFNSSVFTEHKKNNLYENIKEPNKGENGRFNHQQSFSMGLSLFNGMPQSAYSYTNVFSYKIREGLYADVKIHGRFLSGAYNDLWSSNLYSGPSLSGSAGLKYSPMNNGVFDIQARAYQEKDWSGQSVYLTMFGIPIKRIYKSRDWYRGPHNVD